MRQAIQRTEFFDRLAKPGEAMRMYRNLGRALKLARETKGIGQAELARRAKLGRSQLSKYETGKELPKLDSLQKLCQALEVEPYQIFYTMYLFDRSEETVIRPVKAPGSETPTSGILPPETEASFKRLWDALFTTYNTVVGDRMRSVPSDEVWTKN